MSRAVPELPVQGADAPDLLPSSQPGWLQRNRHLIGLGLSLLLFGLALVACWHLVREINPDQVRESLAAVSPQALLGALLATVLGFLVMLAYEWSASRYADVDLPPPTLALGGFCAFAIGNAVGLSALSGGSVRYRLYGRNGLSAGDVARMSLFASLSLGVSLPILAALAACSTLRMPRSRCVFPSRCWQSWPSPCWSPPRPWCCWSAVNAWPSAPPLAAGRSIWDVSACVCRACA